MRLQPFKKSKKENNIYYYQINHCILGGDISFDWIPTQLQFHKWFHEICPLFKFTTRLFKLNSTNLKVVKKPIEFSISINRPCVVPQLMSFYCFLSFYRQTPFHMRFNSVRSAKSSNDRLFHTSFRAFVKILMNHENSANFGQKNSLQQKKSNTLTTIKMMTFSNTKNTVQNYKSSLFCFFWACCYLVFSNSLTIYLMTS